MPKYNQYTSTAEYEARKRKTTLHPIWRGVGFILMILIPIVAYFVSTWLLDLNSTNQWMEVPREFLSRGADKLVYVKIGMTVVLSIVVYGVMMLVGFVVMGLFGPPRYGEMDVPPIKNSGNRKRLD